MSEPVSVEMLKVFLEAFNRHELDAIMSFFAQDCISIYRAAPRHAVTAASARTMCELDWQNDSSAFPDVHYGGDGHRVCGDFGVSGWPLTGTALSGKKIEARGVDLLEFAEGKTTRKHSFWKILE